MKPHLRAQAALVRMIYDPGFAQAVKEGASVPGLPEDLRAELAAIDLRALRRDEHRRERTLGQLCAELPCTTALALGESGRMALLLDFYQSAAFHRAIDDGGALVLALGEYLEEQLAEGTLRSPHLAAVLALELASARARRDGEETSSTPPPPGDAAVLRRSRGVAPVRVPNGTLATLQRVEQHRFRLGLMPGWALVTDPPALPALPALGPDAATLVAVAIRGQVSLVEIEAPLYAVLASLPQPRARRAILDEASQRLNGDRALAASALDSLIADELIVTS